MRRLLLLSFHELDQSSFSLVVNLCTSFLLAFILYPLPTFLWISKGSLGTPCPNPLLYRWGDWNLVGTEVKSWGQDCHSLVPSTPTDQRCPKRWACAGLWECAEQNWLGPCPPGTRQLLSLRDTKQRATEINTPSLPICYEGKFWVLWGWSGKVSLRRWRSCSGSKVTLCRHWHICKTERNSPFYTVWWIGNRKGEVGVQKGPDGTGLMGFGCNTRCG